VTGGPADLVDAILDPRPDQAAVGLIDGRGRPRTRGWVARRVRGLAAGLRADGLEPGDGVLFSIRPSADSIVAALAIVAAGGTVIFADPGGGHRLFSARMRLARPRWAAAESLLYAAGSRGPLRAVARTRGLLLPDLGGLDVRHLHSGPRLPGVPKAAKRLEALIRADGPVPAPADPAAPAVVVFTSGTTARPRAVVHTRGSLAAAGSLLAACCPVGPGHVVHTEQLMLGLPALAAGATWSLPRTGGSPARFAAELAERGATCTFAVPVDLARVLDVVPRLPDRLAHVLLGAAPVPPALLRRVTHATGPGTRILSVYGMTEILPVAVTDAAAKLDWRGTGDLVGRPLPGVRVRIGDRGELHAAGPNQAAYLGEPPRAEIATGDRARVEPDGRIVLEGRLKDMLIRGHFNLYPGLYEPVVAALPGVAEAAFAGLPDPATGDETVVLALVATAGADPVTLPALVKARLPGLIDADALPDRIVVVPALPRSGRSRKLDRVALTALVRP
jgi:acyl-CoA synthetase (AMP-forming)/AMP-acid ligase II